MENNKWYAMKKWMIKESEIYSPDSQGRKDDVMINVLNATHDKSFVVMGSAGSGKSVLALIKAQHIQHERSDNYQTIVFTKSLCHYMEFGGKELNLHNNIFYHYNWKWKKVLEVHEDGTIYTTRILNMPSADYTIVDEIQDFTKEEIQEFIDATRQHFFFFGDTAQSIYDWRRQAEFVKVSDIPKLFSNKERIKEFTLYYNYRLPLPVAKLAQYIGIDLPPFNENMYKSPVKELPYVLGYDNLYAQVQDIYHRIENFSLTDVAILLVNNILVEQVGKMLLDLGLHIEMKYKTRNGYINTLDFSTSKPKVMTYHSAKGLQFEHVFIPALENIYEGGSHRSLYVAMTRTYKNLYIMYSGSLPPFWKQLEIPQSVYQTESIIPAF